MRRKAIALILALAVCLALVGSALAMSSANYRIDWLIPLTGGGGRGSSAHYSTHLSFGQTAVGLSTSPGYQAGMGYWRGIAAGPWELFLPLTIRP
jgi:hypothetical protein